ncbi:hypothetical protein GSF22_25185, partial [Micromonospora echinofusca]|nr:hypothetical protein [Micromonospora echinofusca]
MSRDGGQPSWRMTALIALSGGLFALVGGMAVNTVQVPAGWRPLIWLLTAVLLASVVLLAVLNLPGGAAAGLVRITRRPAVWLVGAALAGFALAALIMPTVPPATGPVAGDDHGTATSQPPRTDQPATPTTTGSPPATAPQ